MADIKVHIPDDVLEDLKRSLKLHTGPDVVMEALKILNWAVGEKEQNRTIYSLDSDNRAAAKLALKSLT